MSKKRQPPSPVEVGPNGIPRFVSTWPQYEVLLGLPMRSIEADQLLVTYPEGHKLAGQTIESSLGHCFDGMERQQLIAAAGWKGAKLYFLSVDGVHAAVVLRPRLRPFPVVTTYNHRLAQRIAARQQEEQLTRAALATASVDLEDHHFTTKG